MTKYLFRDRVELDAAANVRKLEDGRIVARPRVARTGIQLYRGSEVGRPNMDVVRVYRSPQQVFAPEAMKSFLHVAVTNDHPPEMVTPANFVKYSRGWTGDEAENENNRFLRVPMMLADAGLVSDYEGGKNQLSNGYVCALDWTGGTDPDTGEKYDAQQINIRGNHVAVVGMARGGQDLRIGDAMVITDEDTKTCPECGTKMPMDAKKCPNCGYAMDSWAVDKDYTPEQRRELAKSGKALPNGSYPIVNRSDLENAISSYGRNPTPAVKKHIMKRAKALGLEELIPAKWTDAAFADDADLRDRVGYNGEVNMTVRNITLDGVALEVSDVAASVITAYLGRLDKATEALKSSVNDSTAAAKTAKDALDAAVAKHATEIAAKDAIIATKDAENATLKKQVTDASSPAALDAAVRDRAAIIGKAKAILADKLVVDGKTNHELMKQVVDAHMGDKAKDWTEAQVKISFDTMTVKTDGVTDHTVDAFSGQRPGPGTANVYDIARAFSAGGGGTLDPVSQAYADRDKALGDAWKTPAARQ